MARMLKVRKKDKIASVFMIEDYDGDIALTPRDYSIAKELARRIKRLSA